MKTIVKSLCVFLLLLALCMVAASFYMLDYSLSALHRSRVEAIERLDERCPQVSSWVDSIISNKLLLDTTICLKDGTERHGYYLLQDSCSKGTAIVVHGYKDCALSMLHIGYMYNHDLGYDIFLPDLWAHGESPGDNIGMGWNERHEVIEWCEVAHGVTHCDAMVLHGISMGGATVMNVSGEKLPVYVKAIIEDCGFNSVWDEFSAQLDDQFGLPEFPLMYTTSALCSCRYGWSWREASSERQVAKCCLPMFFIHGDDDSFVPTAMVHRVYNAHHGPKQLWLAPGSAHARAYADHQQEYTRRVDQFLARYVKENAK